MAKKIRWKQRRVDGSPVIPRRRRKRRATARICTSCAAVRAMSSLAPRAARSSSSTSNPASKFASIARRRPKSDLARGGVARCASSTLPAARRDPARASLFLEVEQLFEQACARERRDAPDWMMHDQLMRDARLQYVRSGRSRQTRRSENQALALLRVAPSLANWGELHQTPRFASASLAARWGRASSKANRNLGNDQYPGAAF